MLEGDITTRLEPAQRVTENTEMTQGVILRRYNVKQDIARNKHIRRRYRYWGLPISRVVLPVFARKQGT